MLDGTDLPSPLFTAPHRLKLGVFHMNCTRGATPTLAEGSIASLSWAQQVQIAQAAERAGLDAIIPIARWRGYGGPSRFNEEQFEAIPWAAALAALTERIVVFSTVHVPLIHPVRAAKYVATIDHISNGRFCLNVVAGWNDAELRMFGVEQREHDERYRIAAEWVTFVQRLWSEQAPFDFSGDYYQGQDIVSEPKPISRPRPPIMSAGSSPAGREFAARFADVCFVAALTTEELAEVARDVKARAAQHGRSVSVWTQVGVILGDTEADARRAYEHFVHERGDWDAVYNQMDLLLSGGGQTLNFEQSRPMLERMIAMQSAQLLQGTAERIVNDMVALNDAGVDGLSLIWMDYEHGLAGYDAQIRPLAVSAGLRSS